MNDDSSTNAENATTATYNSPPPDCTTITMPTLDDLADRIERLVLRHEELERTNALLRQQLDGVVSERDTMRSRLTAARARIDTLLERLPTTVAVSPPTDGAST